MRKKFGLFLLKWSYLLMTWLKNGRHGWGIEEPAPQLPKWSVISILVLSALPLYGRAHGFPLSPNLLILFSSLWSRRRLPQAHSPELHFRLPPPSLAQPSTAAASFPDALLLPHALTALRLRLVPMPWPWQSPPGRWISLGFRNPAVCEERNQALRFFCEPV